MKKKNEDQKAPEKKKYTRIIVLEGVVNGCVSYERQFDSHTYYGIRSPGFGGPEFEKKLLDVTSEDSGIFAAALAIAEATKEIRRLEGVIQDYKSASENIMRSVNK